MDFDIVELSLENGVRDSLLQESRSTVDEGRPNQVRRETVFCAKIRGELHDAK